MKERREELRKLMRLIEKLELPLPVGIVVAEEFARELAERVGESFSNVLKRIEVKTPRWVTKRVLFREERVAGSLDILNVEISHPMGEGRIREIVIISPSPNFEFVLMLDGTPVVNDKFENLLEESEDYDYLTAYERDGVYHLSVGDLKFLRRAHAFIQVFEPITFKKIHALYDIRT